MTTLFTTPFVPALNLIGGIAGAATLTFYLTGTTTLQTIYDADGNPLSNPITADAFGRFDDIYLDPMVIYRVVEKDKFGALLGDVDPFVGAPTAANSIFIAAGTGAIVRTVQNKLRDIFDIRDFGAVPGTDISAALTAAAIAASSYATTNGAIRIPAGQWRLQTNTNLGACSLIGDGSRSSLIFIDNNSKITFTGGGIGQNDYPISQINISGLYFETTSTHHVGTVIDIGFSTRSGGSVPARTLYIEDVQLLTANTTNSFDLGINLFNCTNLVMSHVTVANAYPIQAGSIGVQIGGDLQPVDMHFDGVYVSFCDTAFNGIGTGFGLGFEGLYFDKCLALFCNIGVNINSATAHTLVTITNCNINCFQKNIVINNMDNIHITNNALYVASAPWHTIESDWIGIQIDNNDANLNYGSNNIITNNRFVGTPTPNPPIKTGITVDALNGANTATIIGKNVFADIQYIYQLFSGSNNVIIHNDNLYDGAVTTVFTNSGTSNSYAPQGCERDLPFTVSTLPTNIQSGTRAYVTDATLTTFATTVAG